MGIFGYIVALFSSRKGPVWRRAAMLDMYLDACLDVGRGEEPPRSNDGPFIEKMRKYLKLPRLGGGEWCALFCSYHLWRNGIKVKSRGARDLVRKLASYGHAVPLDSDELVPGFIGLSLHNRNGGHHVRVIRITANAVGRRFVTAIGGNENSEVRVTEKPLDEYLRTTVRIATA